ncbi:MAG: phosphotransferase [Pseudomonadota bacterium]
MVALPPIERWSVQANLRPLGGGSRNAVFRTVGLLQDIVFKTTDRSDAALDWLEAVYDAAEAAGLIVPRLIRSQQGALSEAGWTAEPFLEGQVIPEEDIGRLKPLMERFHKLSNRLAQRPGYLSAYDLLKANAGGDVDFTEMPTSVVSACRAAFAALDTPEMTVIHGDLNTSNVLQVNLGGIALLDWDEARRDHPAFDMAQLSPATQKEALACLAWEVACCWSKEPDRARNLAAELMARTS